MSKVALDFKDRLLETLDYLPPDKQAEILDFADFMKAKLEAEAATLEILQDKETMARLKASEEDLEAGRVVEL